jgi:hypothetical protein
MKVKCLVLSIAVFFILTKPAQAGPVSTSTAKDQVSVEVTVYNSNLGLVKDTRRVSLADGEGELRFMDVASHINPVTVRARSLNFSTAFTVIEQNYEYDLMNANKLLDKYVGKRIKLIDWNRTLDTRDVVEAELLSNNQGQIYRINDEIYLGHPGYRVLPEIPENLIAKPTLMWLYSSGTTRPHELEVSYLTNNINWKADYVMVLDSDDTSSDLSGWVTVDNKSGAAYTDARLKLVAGEVQRAEERFDRRLYKGKVMAEAAAPMFVEKGFFEYHIYDLTRPTTIKDRQTKQVGLLEARGVGVDKELIVRGIKSYFTRLYRETNPKQPVDVFIKFKNSKQNSLGMPLPAGIMRLYKEDQDESLQFIGENRIDHTPKDEEVSLKVGEAFDVVAERIQTGYKAISSRLHETAWEVTLRNHKEEGVKVSIVEPLYGDWRVISRSHPYKKIDAFTIRFDVEVPRDKEVKVTYRIRVKTP